MMFIDQVSPEMPDKELAQAMYWPLYLDCAIVYLSVLRS